MFTLPIFGTYSSDSGAAPDTIRAAVALASVVTLISAIFSTLWISRLLLKQHYSLQTQILLEELMPLAFKEPVAGEGRGHQPQTDKPTLDGGQHQQRLREQQRPPRYEGSELPRVANEKHSHTQSDGQSESRVVKILGSTWRALAAYSLTNSSRKTGKYINIAR